MGTTGASAFVALILNGTLISAASFIFDNKCTRDSKYLCENLSNAKDCKATRQCISFWEEQPVSLDTNLVCKICKNTMEKARNKLPCDNEEAELMGLFDNSLKEIPLKKIQNEYRIQAKNSLPELIDLLSSKMTHDQICSMIGLCNSGRIDEILSDSYLKALDGRVDEDDVELDLTEKSRQSRKVSQPDQVSCSTCNLLTLAMKGKFVSTNREQMVEQLLHTCYSLSSLSETCANIVMNYFDDFYELARNHFESNNFCHVAGICTGAEEGNTGVEVQLSKHEEALSEDQSDQLAEDLLLATDVESTGLLGGAKCGMCKKAIKLFQKAIGHVADKIKIKTRLLEGCQHMNVLQHSCEKMVKDYGKKIAELFADKAKSSTICGTINICKKKAIISYNCSNNILTE